MSKTTDEVKALVKQGITDPYKVAEATGLSATYCQVIIRQCINGVRPRATREVKDYEKNSMSTLQFSLKVGDIVKATDGNFGSGKFIITAIYPHIFTCQKVGGRYPRRTSFCKNQYYCKEVVKC